MSWILSIAPIQPRNYLHIWQGFSDSSIACFADEELYGIWSTGQSLWFKCLEIGMTLCSDVKRQDFIYGALINVVLCILVLTWGRPLADVYACGKLYIATTEYWCLSRRLLLTRLWQKMLHIFKIKTELVFSVRIKG